MYKQVKTNKKYDTEKMGWKNKISVLFSYSQNLQIDGRQTFAFLGVPAQRLGHRFVQFLAEGLEVLESVRVL